MFKKLRKKTRNANIGRTLRHAANGTGITSRFIRRNLLAIGVFVWVCISMIAVRYDCLTSLETIQKKSRELEFVRTQKQSERSRYMTSTRESAMLHKIDSLKMGLTIQDRPPYRLKND